MRHLVIVLLAVVLQLNCAGTCLAYDFTAAEPTSDCHRATGPSAPASSPEHDESGCVGHEQTVLDTSKAPVINHNTSPVFLGATTTVEFEQTSTWSVASIATFSDLAPPLSSAINLTLRI